MNFYIIIKNRVAEVLSDGGRLPLLVCGNADNRIIFTFDDEWADYGVKTARFVYRENRGHGDFVYTDVSFNGSSVTIPVLQNISELWVGVIANGTITTSAARIACVSSISGFSAEEVSVENVTVTLALADGDQTVSSDLGMRSVTIRKPNTLLPQNIREGVEIAGVVGTYALSATETVTLETPVISLDGDILTIESGLDGVDFYDLCVDGKSICTYTDISVTQIDLSALFETYTLTEGEHAIAVCTSLGGVTSELSNAVTYTVTVEAEPLTPPTLSTDGEYLVVDTGDAEYTSIVLYVNGEEYRTLMSSGTKYHLVTYLPDVAPGEATAYVRAYCQSQYADSEELTFTMPAYINAPEISIEDGTMTITPSSGNIDVEFWNFYVNGESSALLGKNVLSYSVADYFETKDPTNGTYAITVKAYSETYKTWSEDSNALDYEWSGHSNTLTLQVNFPEEVASSVLYKILTPSADLDSYGSELADGLGDGTLSSGGSIAVSSDDLVLIYVGSEGGYEVSCSCGTAAVYNTNFVTVQSVTASGSVEITKKSEATVETFTFQADVSNGMDFSYVILDSTDTPEDYQNELINGGGTSAGSGDAIAVSSGKTLLLYMDNTYGLSVDTCEACTYEILDDDFIYVKDITGDANIYVYIS